VLSKWGAVLAAILTLSGCASVPSSAIPEAVFRDVAKGGKTDSLVQAPSAPQSAIETVLRYIAVTLKEDAGLRIAAVIAEEGESSYVFAAPEKSGELLAICIKEINIADQSSGIRLTLVLRVFDGYGENIYTRSITGVSGAGPPQNDPSALQKALQVVTEEVLRQYTKDPTLRPLIMKYKLGSLLKFI